MVPELIGTERLAATFAALAHPARLAILERLRDGEASVEELAEPFDMSRRAVSKHVAVLENAGLVSRTRDAQRRPSRLRAESLQRVDEWLDAYRQLWLGRFDRLEDRLSTLRSEERDGDES